MADEKIVPENGLEVRYERYKGIIKNFTNRSKNSLTSIGDGMNCTFEHICSNS